MDITVIGLGYVGTVGAASRAAAGRRVLGVDIDPDRTKSMQSGAIPFYEPGLGEIVHSAVATGRLRFTHRDTVDQPLGELALIATGTPQTEGGGADLNQVRSAVSWIKSRGADDTVILLRSVININNRQRLLPL